MPAFNFMKRFEDDVQFGIKLQTIRAVRKDRRMPCKTGDNITLYTGMRTKGCRKLGEGVCTSILQLEIKEYPPGQVRIFVDCDMLLRRDEFELSDKDGFENLSEFYKFFREAHKFPFIGWLINWRLLP